MQALDGQPRIVGELSHVLAIRLSSDGQWLAAETTEAPDAPHHTIHLSSAVDGTERSTIELAVDPKAQAPWCLSNDCFCYLATDGLFLALNPSTHSTRESPQAPVAYAAIAVSKVGDIPPP